jgi:selenocysteine lyase/cysteine desulfurase
VIDDCLFLDHAGVAPISTRVCEAIQRFADEAARDLRRRYPYWNERAEEVRGTSARLVGCEARQVAFVKNTSEALSLVAEGLDWKPGDVVLLGDREFPSNVYPWWGLRRLGVETRMLASDGSGISPEAVAAAFDERVRVVALSAIGYGTGDRLDLKRIATLCHERGAFFVVDGIQAIGAVAIDMARDGLDCIAADGHKWLCAPEGAGFVALSDALLDALRPIELGWKSVSGTGAFYPYEFRLRCDAAKLEPGSLNLLALHALGAAVDLALEVGPAEIEDRLAGLTQALILGIEERQLRVLGPSAAVRQGRAGGEVPATSGIVTFVPRGDPERVRQELWARGVVTKVRFGGIRAAPHYYQDGSDVARFLAALDEAEAAVW